MGKERKGFLQADVGPGMGKTRFALVIAMERCEQGLHLDNSVPGSLGAVKSVGDGSHAHLAHPDMSAGSAMCTGVLLPHHPEKISQAGWWDGVNRVYEQTGLWSRGNAEICTWKLSFYLLGCILAP